MREHPCRDHLANDLHPAMHAPGFAGLAEEGLFDTAHPAVPGPGRRDCHVAAFMAAEVDLEIHACCGSPDHLVMADQPGLVPDLQGYWLSGLM